MKLNILVGVHFRSIVTSDAAVAIIIIIGFFKEVQVSLILHSDNHFVHPGLQADATGKSGGREDTSVGLLEGV
jgi:hypothetical protein